MTPDRLAAKWAARYAHDPSPRLIAPPHVKARLWLIRTRIRCRLAWHDLTHRSAR